MGRIITEPISGTRKSRIVTPPIGGGFRPSPRRDTGRTPSKPIPSPAPTKTTEQERQEKASRGYNYFYDGNYHKTAPTQAQLDNIANKGGTVIFTGTEGQLRDFARQVKGAPPSVLEVGGKKVTREQFEKLRGVEEAKAAERFQQQKVFREVKKREVEREPTREEEIKRLKEAAQEIPTIKEPIKALKEFGKLATFGLLGKTKVEEVIEEAERLGVPIKGKEALKFGLGLSATIPAGVALGAGLGALGTVGTVVGIAGTAAAGPEIVKGIKNPATRSKTLGELLGFGLGAGRGARTTRGKELIGLLKARLFPKGTKLISKGGKDFVRLVSKDGKKLDIELLKPGLGKLGEPLSKQVKTAGTKRTIVSAQRGLFNFLTQEKLVKKPIAGIEKGKPQLIELLLDKQNTKLLKKFDKGLKLTTKELKSLDDAIFKAGGPGLLERSFFADPAARLRLSRLGLEKPKEAGIRDIITGDFTLREPSGKAQALIFKDVNIADLTPRLLALFKRVQKGDSKAINLFQDEFLKFQLEKTGEFKPIGFLSQEPEVTLAPGEIIFKEGIAGRAIIEGRPVEFIEAGVKKATSKTAKLLEKSRLRQLTSKERAELQRRLSQESRGLSRETKDIFEGEEFDIISGVGKEPKPVLRVSPRVPPSEIISGFSGATSSITGEQSRISRVTSRPSPRTRPSRTADDLIFGRSSAPPSRPPRVSKSSPAPSRISNLILGSPSRPPEEIKSKRPLTKKARKKGVEKPKKEVDELLFGDPFKGVTIPSFSAIITGKRGKLPKGAKLSGFERRLLDPEIFGE